VVVLSCSCSYQMIPRDPAATTPSGTSRALPSHRLLEPCLLSCPAFTATISTIIVRRTSAYRPAFLSSQHNGPQRKSSTQLVRRPASQSAALLECTAQPDRALPQRCGRIGGAFLFVSRSRETVMVIGDTTSSLRTAHRRLKGQITR
jgi:hypothetical protein